MDGQAPRKRSAFSIDDILSEPPKPKQSKTKKASTTDKPVDFTEVKLSTIAAINPYTAKAGSKQAGELWRLVAQSLHDTGVPMNMDSLTGPEDGLRQLVARNIARFRKRQPAAEISGTEPDETNLSTLDQIIKEIIEKQKTVGVGSTGGASDSSQRAAGNAFRSSHVAIQGTTVPGMSTGNTLRSARLVDAPRASNTVILHQDKAGTSHPKLVDMTMDADYEGRNVGTLTEATSLGEFSEHIFTLTWTFDALIGQAMMSTSVVRRSQRTIPVAEEWRLDLFVDTADTKCTLLLVQVHHKSPPGILECRKSVKFLRGASEEIHRSPTGSADPAFEFQLANPTECSTFEITVSVLHGGAPRSNTLANIRSLYEKALLTDFWIVAMDAVELPAHRSVLAAGSEVFKAMLTHDTKESRTGTVEINDIDGKTVKVLVDWIYGVQGGLSGQPVTALRLVYMAADKYRVESLMQAVKMEMSKVTQPRSMEECIEQYLFATRYSWELERREVLLHIWQNYPGFVQAGAGGLRALAMPNDKDNNTLDTLLEKFADCKPSGCIRWKLPDVRTLGRKSVYSHTVMVYGVPWRMCAKRGNAQATRHQLAVYLGLSQPLSDPNWSCEFSAYFKLIPHDPSIYEKALVDDLEHVLSIADQCWGLLPFVELTVDKLIDASTGLADPIDYSVQFEVQFTVGPGR